jgi:long-chain acyl-CoA synthetase
MYPGTYAAQAPDRIAAVMTGTGETLSYGDLERRSVQLAHVLYEALVTLAGQFFGVDQDSVYLSPGPIYHAAPLRWCGAIQALGGTVAMMKRFDAEQALQVIQDRRATHAQFVPTMFVRMLQLPPDVRDRYDVSSLQVAIHAAAPCPVEVKQK